MERESESRVKGGRKEKGRKRGCRNADGEVQGGMDGWMKRRQSSSEREKGETSLQIFCMEEACSKFCRTKDHTVCS